MLLRDSMLINGTLTNAEIWYNLTKTEIEEFESLDRLFFRRLLEVPITTPTEAYYLECGVLPINVIVKARRINYLHSILKKDKRGMVYSFSITQWYQPSKGDWTEQVRQDLVDFNIQCSFEFIESKSAEVFKKLVRRKAKEYALRSLQESKAKHSKMDNVAYTKLECQEYFASNQISNDQKIMIFKCRTRMERFGENFRGGLERVMCPLCMLHLDSQDLCLQCPEVRKQTNTSGEDIKEIYGEKIGKDVVDTITKVMEIRRKLTEHE